MPIKQSNSDAAQLPIERLAFGLDDAAAAIGLSKRSLYDFIADGRLTAVKIGGRRLILRDDLVAFLASAREAE